MIDRTFSLPPLVLSIDGNSFEITPQLWQKNQQQKDLLLRYFALPLQENETTLWLGIDDLTNLSACETFSFLTGKVVEPVVLEGEHLKFLLQSLSPQSSLYEQDSQNFYNIEDKIIYEPIVNKTDEPVIQLLDQIFEYALKKKASDIHFEPQANYLQVRFRVDGVLQLQPAITTTLTNRVISRLKLLAKLDISETRLPQDGRFHFKTTFSDVLDFRLSTLPTHFGEKAVLRLQQNKPIQLNFAELGMTDDQQNVLQQALSQPQGLILVTGPTGSGKTITLYTALQWLNDISKHILTAEDPIEIELPGIIQTQVNNQIGLDFSRLLRTFLRQDPDIIMLGEIRDNETASIALRAAQTGHLVLSTLHTNDAMSALSRLQQLGIKSYEIENTLLLVIAQRLVRKSLANSEEYKGRIGIYQFLQPHFIDNQISYQTDFSNLRESALEKIKVGITNITEVERVLGKANDEA
ncbi:GspE/PulE family protein [Seminibacterium arietis]|uniref:GspE/PulE family protein n=1 Tax=Seminibacterium arietis TaxID=1173502 RepID=A0ABW3I724_9PAST